MFFCFIKDSYIDYLRKYDTKVAENKHESRPYIGVVLEIHEYKYYVPFSSPKEKHKHMKNNLDFRKIEHGKLGAINFNNMIPVIDSEIIPIVFSEVTDINYRKLLTKQYNAVQKDIDNITKTAARLRDIILKPNEQLSEYEIKIKNRCCNLSLLEKVCTEMKSPYSS